MCRTASLVALCLVATALFLVGCSDTSASDQAQQTAGAAAANTAGLTLPDGFEATIFADSLGTGRHLTVRENGDVYVALRETGVAALRDTDGDGKAERQEIFGDVGGTGIGLHKGYLYFAPDTEVRRYPMNGDALVPEQEYEVIAEGFPEQNQHAVKPFAFDGDGGMYVNVGAPSNACQEQMRTKGSPGLDPCPQLERHAGVWQFSDSEPGQTQEADGSRYASGIRNAVAITWNDRADNLYVMQHGRDQLHSLWPERYTQKESAELPAGEFFKVDANDDFGWPYCYYDQRKDQKMLAPEYGGDGSEVGRCSEFEDPIAAFPGHWAPNDLLFYNYDENGDAALPSRYQNGAFIAFHGSWNRAPFPQQGYKVVFVPFEGSSPSGDYEVFANGFAARDTIESPSQAKHRPCGLAIGPDGALYVADSQQGRIYKITYTGSAGA
jgi:glucose/arabinose dehydrogenase